MVNQLEVKPGCGAQFNNRRYNAFFAIPVRSASVRADKSLSPFEIRLYRHYRIVHGIRIALA
ncbi:hypothetical protein ONR07_24580, partial [Salmonella enterica subsp. enterica serovar Anatum]|nr:hypothetical protein [Salmonella enterica subsp. enterica serovar Anatum]